MPYRNPEQNLIMFLFPVTKTKSEEQLTRICEQRSSWFAFQTTNELFPFVFILAKESLPTTTLPIQQN